MKRLIITVAIGEGIRPFYEKVSRRRFKAYARKCKADFVAITKGGTGPDGKEVFQEWWGLEKMRVGLPYYTDGYDQILYLDADVIVQRTAANIFKQHTMGRVGIHDDWPALGENGDHAWAQPVLDKLMREQGLPIYKVHRCLNSGVVLFDKHTTDIWNMPKRPFTPSHCAEQWWVDYQIGDRAYILGQNWNCQYWMKEFATTWQQSDFVHLASMGEDYEHLETPTRLEWWAKNKNRAA